MDTKKLAGLEPRAVFYYFEEICAIPHGSGNTKAIEIFLDSSSKKPSVTIWCALQRKTVCAIFRTI